MSMIRGFVVIVYTFVFIMALFVISSAWSLIEYLEAYVKAAIILKAAIIFDLLVALCGVLISIFVYIDGKEIDRLKSFTGLTKHEEEARFRMEAVYCGSCAYFGKPALCKSREKNPYAEPCMYYRKKESNDFQFPND